MKPFSLFDRGERRRANRIPMGVSVLIPIYQKKIICQDLSDGGCFFKALDLGPVGKILSIYIDLPEMGLIQIETRIVHKGEDGLGSGLQFTSIDPEDRKKLNYFLDLFR